MTRSEVEFEGGRNVAMKVRPHQWEQTVGSYRDLIGLEVIEHDRTSRPASASSSVPTGSGSIGSST